MTNGKDKDKRSFDQLVGDIESVIDKLEKKGVPLQGTVAADKASQSTQESTKDQVTAQKLKQVQRAYSGATIKIAGRHNRKIVGLVSILAVSLLAYLYFFVIAPPPPAPPSDMLQDNSLDSLAPVDSRTGDLYVEQRAQFKDGQKRLASGDYSGIKDLNTLVKKSPASPQAAKALLLVGATYQYNLDDQSRANETYMKYLESFPEHRNANATRKRLIQRLFDTGQKELALKVAEELLEYAENEHDKNYARFFIDKYK